MLEYYKKNWRELMLKYRVITFDRTNPSLDWTQLRTSNNQIGNQKLYFWFQIEGNLLGFQKRIKFHLRSTLPGVQVRRHDHLPRGRPQRQSTGRYVPFPRFGTPRKCFVRRSLLRSRAWVIRMGRSHLQGRQKWATRRTFGQMAIGQCGRILSVLLQVIIQFQRA